PEYLEYLVPSDAEVPLEDQPLPADASHIAISPGYVPDSDPEEDSEEDHADYLVDGEDCDDEPSDDDDDTNDEDEEPFKDEGDDEEEEEHLAQADSSAIPKARIAEYAAAPTPPLPVASPPLPLPSPLTTSPTDAGAPLGYMAVEIRMRAAVASPPSLLPSTSHRTDVPEAEMPPRKRACFSTPAPGCEIGESSAAGAARRPGPTPEV
ncbi:hypothetical protein Tco_0172074, partial [Tanacetum coccineum]